MKKFTLLNFLAVFLLSSIGLFAQNGRFSETRNCGTMESLERYFNAYPNARAQFEAQERNLNEQVERILQQNPNYRTTANYTIPIVFHVVLPATGTTSQATITNAMVMAQFNKLNVDYSGLNPDSTNATNWYSVRGHSGIQFCMAARTPGNLPTNGINRVVSSTLSNSSQTNDPIKSTAAGGADAWDPTKYVNIWLCNFTNPSLLGYATFPIGSAENPAGPLNQQGVTVLAQSIPGGTAAPYNLGRTLQHELGHFFHLRHINGDATCGDDFVGDTPTQSDLTGGCPSGNQASGCAASPNPPGRQYQNYMDYTDDACMTMLTVGQTVRMEQALLTYRAGLTTSNGCVPAVSHPYNAAVTAIVNPQPNQGFCGTTSVTPVITITNWGSNTLTQATITVTVDGNASPSTTWTGSLAQTASTNVTLATINGLSGGTHTLNICITNIGGTDGDNSDNCKTVTFSIITGGSGGVPAPYVEGFEGTTYPPNGITLSIPTGQAATTPPNWDRVTTVAHTGTASAREKWWTHSSGRIHNMDLPAINVSPYDNAYISFWYAFRAYSTTAPDSLAVQISTDCGNSWITVWAKGQQGLATNPALATGEYGVSATYPVVASDWKLETIDISAYRSAPVYVRFRGRSGFGNDLYLDDINIYGTINVNNDAGVSAIAQPVGEFCGSSTTPQVTIKNYGLQPLTSVSYRTILDNGTPSASQAITLATPIAPNGTRTVTLNAITGLANGSHTLKIYTQTPNGVLDQQPANDTTTFTSNVAVTLPIVEGFEGTAFPPAGWARINPDNGISWARTTAARKSGTASAMVDHFNYTTAGQLDYLRAPLTSFPSTVDSAIVNFQYAYKAYSATLTDTLEVVVSTDCGVNWTSIWKRGGSQLATNPGLGGAGFVPTAADWTTVPIEVLLQNYIGSGNLFIAFRTKNGFGNNLYIDDINIRSVTLPDYDAQLVSIIDPNGDVCDNFNVPKVRVRNQGKIAMTSVKVGYFLNGGATLTTQTFPVTLGRGKDTVLTLNTINGLAAGNNTIKAFTYDPNGQVDQNKTNDTLTATFFVRLPGTAPLAENFEGAAFPPAGWQIAQQPTDAITWTKTNVGPSRNNTAYMNNYNYAFLGRVDDLISPPVKFGAVDSVFLKFDVAAYTYSYPGSTAIDMDTLKVMVTTDCGKTYTPVYVKYGADLQTLNTPNSGSTIAFKPLNDTHWRTDSINLTSLLRNGANVRIAFRNIENYENNIYIDNINLSTETLPAKLKNEGFMIAPSPFTSWFAVQHYLPPTNLKSLGVYDALGRQLVSNIYNGNAESYIHIDMRRFAAGMYTVKLTYENKVVAQRVIKLN